MSFFYTDDLCIQLWWSAVQLATRGVRIHLHSVFVHICSGFPFGNMCGRDILCSFVNCYITIKYTMNVCTQELTVTIVEQKT